MGTVSEIKPVKMRDVQVREVNVYMRPDMAKDARPEEKQIVKVRPLDSEGKEIGEEFAMPLTELKAKYEVA